VFTVVNDTIKPNSFFNNISLFGEYRKIGINASNPIYFNATDNFDSNFTVEIKQNGTRIYFNETYLN